MFSLRLVGVVMLCGTVDAFAVLPYVQIDFVHYFRLAQCEAKCTQKYGSPTKRRLHDGTFTEFTAITDDNGKFCELGCHRRRTYSKKVARSVKQPLEDGARFWSESSAHAGRSGASPVSAVRMGCMNVSPSEEAEFEDSIEGIVFIDMVEYNATPIRYIIQWKQQVYVRGAFEESGWITASIEPEPSFKVEGMVPNVQYRFMVTVVGPDGRLGSPVMGEWAEALSLGLILRPPVGILDITPKYDSDNGVSALVSWSNAPHIYDTTRESTNQRLASFDSCHYRITFMNKTHQLSASFVMDSGAGFLLSHLEFSCEYTVSLSALPAIMSESASASPPIEEKFVTLACNEVYGPGSLNCSPEPVHHLRVQVLPNGTADVSWIPSSDHSAILVYQLFYRSLTEQSDCLQEPVSLYLNATSTSARIQLKGRQPCEYIVRLINYDLIGRDAVSEAKATVRFFSTGQIRGRHVITSRNTSGYVFLGIPYAESPLGELRYRAPRPVQPWKGIIDVKEYKASCLWNSTITSNIAEFTRMSEDCLTLNVFTNAKCLLNGGCAVVYMIHGGDYNFDSPMLYPIDFLVDNFVPEERSVLVVTVTYRLGSFGFLNLSPNLKSSAVKNVGLLDMIEGLRWVQKEISNLGGDPNRVTLMGHSSGAVNAHQLTVSPLTEGLFHQAIIMSALLGIPIPPNNGERVSKQFAIAAGCAHEKFNNKDAEAVEIVLNCLRKVDGKKLLAIQRDIEDNGFMFQGPCVDGPDGVLPETIEELLKRARPIKMMIGTVGKEMQNTDYLQCADGSVDRQGVKGVCTAVAVMFGYRKKREAARTCTKEYVKPNKTPYILDDPCFFVNSALYSEALIKAGGVVYLYQFDYANVGDAFYLGPLVPKYTSAQSPHHTQEFVYIVGIHLGNFTEKDEIIRVKFSQLLIDFINKGDPSPLDQRWTKLRPELMNYFDIDFDEENNMPGMKYAYHAHEIKFWNRTMLRAGGGTVPITDEAQRQSKALVDVMGIPTANSGSGACYTKESAKPSKHPKWGSHATAEKNFHNLIVGSNMPTAPESTISKDVDESGSTDWSTLIFIVSMLIMVITASYAVLSSRRERRAEYERFD